MSGSEVRHLLVHLDAARRANLQAGGARQSRVGPDPDTKDNEVSRQPALARKHRRYATCPFKAGHLGVG